MVYRALGYSGRPFLKYAWRKIPEHNIVVVEAPTGYGKTALSQAFSLYSLSENFKSVIAYPLRSLLEDQVQKFRYLMDNLGHRDIVGTRYMHHLDSYYFVKPITLTTIDTLSMCLFGLEPRDLDKSISQYLEGSITWTLGHYLFARSTVLLSNIVLDEAHLLADTTKSLNFLRALLIIARQNDLKLLLESATLPKAFIETLKSIERDIEVIKFDESIDPDFVEDREKKEIDFTRPYKVEEDKYEVILEWLREGKKIVDNEGLRALLVFNTVREALEMYNRLMASEFKEYEIILLHSRFTEKDRYAKINKLRELTGRLKRILGKENAGEKVEYIVVATQVIEAGVDISSNVFITDIAPANSLIQRLGRFLRYEGETHGFLRIWYEEPNKKNMYKVYDLELVRRTIEYLRGHKKFNPHLPAMYHGLLDSVYRREDFVIKYTEVSQLVNLTLVVESPYIAIRKFVELGGSFIRESVMVPVVAANTLNDKLEIIPLGITSLKPEHVIGELVKKNNKIIINEEKEPLPRNKNELIKRILRKSLDKYFIAFIVKGEYDPVKGLVLGE